VQGKVFIQFVVDEHGKVIPNVENNGEITPPPIKPGANDTPAASATSGFEGIVVVGFRTPEGVEPKSYTEEHKRLLIDEAIRVIKLPYKWTPAMKDGKTVKMQFTFPIQFLLQ
jgi:hypothetical protein